MEDPINCVRLLQEELVNIIQTDDPEETEQRILELRKDIEQGALKNKPGHYFLMTLNINKATSVGKGTEEKRRRLLDIIMNNFFADVIFVQDLPNKHTDIKQMLSHDSDLKASQTEREAAVIWNEKKFEATEKDFYSTDTTMIRVYEKLGLTSGLLGRLKIVKLTSKEKKHEYPSFLACSWHGENISELERSTEYTNLQRFLRALSEANNNIPIVVGGDFNIDTTGEAKTPKKGKPKDEKERQANLSEGFSVSFYQQTKRAETANPNYIPYKDNFMVYGIKQISMQWVQAIDLFADFKEKLNETMERLLIEDIEEMQAVKEDIESVNTYGKVEYLLDHDPIVGVLKLSNTSIM